MKDLKRSAKEFIEKTRKPEGPKDYFVYKGDFGIYFATNGKVKVCWIKPCTMHTKYGDKKLPGFWKDVNSTRKVDMDGNLVPMNYEEQWQHSTGHF